MSLYLMVFLNILSLSYSSYLFMEKLTCEFHIVNSESGLDEIASWVRSMHSFSNSSQDPQSVFGYHKLLIGNKTDTPGNRKIFSEEAQSFASRYGMSYFETSNSDETQISEEMFKSMIEAIVKNEAMPIESVPTATYSGFLTPIRMKSGFVTPSGPRPALTNPNSFLSPIGIHLGLSMEPQKKVSYRQKLRESQPNRDCCTNVVDWL